MPHRPRPPTKRPHPALPAVAVLFVLALTGPGQAQDPAEATGEQPSASQETDVNEDNYRRFMELRDAQLQRPNQPYAALAGPGALEKLGQLPESSQKHLRNQLRSIIVDRGRWNPAERDRLYPFVSSPAAEQDRDLRAREAEAWEELVANYHAREAEIFQSAARAGGPGGPGDTAHAGAADATTESDRGMTRGAGRQGAGSNANAAASAGNSSGAESGVAQNAMEYLQRSGQTGPAGDDALAPSGGEDSDTPTDSVADAGAQPGQAGDDPARAGDLSASGQARTAPGTSPADPNGDPEVVYRSEGVIAIRDLEKLGGLITAQPDEPEEEAPAGDDDG